MAEPLPTRPRRSVFNKTGVARLVNLLLWFVFCGMAGTGFLLAFRLPRGTGRSLTALGLGRHDWGDWHTWLAWAFLALIALHLVLHWRWLWQAAAKKRSWQLLLGLGLGLGMMLFLFFQPVTSVKNERGEGRRQGHGRMEKLVR